MDQEREEVIVEQALFAEIPDPEPTLDRKRSAWLAALVLVCVAGLFLFLSLATPKAVPWSVAAGKLQIRTRVWTDDFPLSDLRLDQTRVLDLNREPGWRPRHKLRGYDGFGFDAGLFKLRNGASADIYLTNETTAVLIPRQGDVPVIVGARDPQSLLAALNNPPR